MRRIESPRDLAPLQTAGKALLLFTAQTCPDSPFVKERLEKIAARNSSLVVATADLGRVPGLAKALGITRAPTVVLFRRGQRVSDLSGRVTGLQMQNLVDSVLW